MSPAYHNFWTLFIIIIPLCYVIQLDVIDFQSSNEMLDALRNTHLLPFNKSLFQQHLSIWSKGVQYLHWVMHKCIMVKVGGRNEIHRKYVKSRWFFRKQGGIFESRGEHNNFRETGGEMYWNRETEGEIRNLWSMTKNKVIRNFGWWKSKKFSGKVTFLKFSTESDNFSKIGGKSETGREMHHCLRGDGRPWSEGLYACSNRHFLKYLWSSKYSSIRNQLGW